MKTTDSVRSRSREIAPGPLGVWLIKRGDSTEIDAHGKESLNFQISMLIYDALEMNFRKTRIPKDPECPLCSARPRITDLSGDYAVSCGL